MQVFETIGQHNIDDQELTTEQAIEKFIAILDRNPVTHRNNTLRYFVKRGNDFNVLYKANLIIETNKLPLKAKIVDSVFGKELIIREK